MKESNIYRELKSLVDQHHPIWGKEILEIVRKELRKRITITFDIVRETNYDNATDILDELLVELDKLSPETVDDDNKNELN